MPNPWIIAAEIGLSVGLHYLNKWLSDPPPEDRARRFTDVPITTEGTPLPLVFGKQRIRRPILYWYGGFKQRNADSIFGDIVPTDQDGNEVPYYYGINLLFCVGLPHFFTSTNTGARLTGVYFGERKLDVNLGEGEAIYVGKSEAVQPGVGNSVSWNTAHGLIQFFGGGSAQAISDNVPGDLNDITEIAHFMRRAGIAGEDIPGYRHQMLVALSGNRAVKMIEGEIENGDVLDAFFFGGTLELPEISFEVYTARNAFVGVPPINGDACPAAAIYEILTLRLGVDPAKIDTTSFTNSAVTLSNEVHGYANVIDAQRSAKSALQDIVNQIGAVLYEDQVTGKWHLKLLRDDYSPLTIPSYDARHVEDVERYIVGGWPDAINRVIVTYNDRLADYEDSTAIAFNQAAAVTNDYRTDLGTASGDNRVVPIEYRGCSNKKLADQLAARDLTLLSQPLSQLRVVFNRQLDLLGTSNAALLRPGSVFKLALPDHHINDVVFRVTKVDLGQHGNSAVTVDAVSDVFSYGSRAADGDGGGYVAFIPGPYPIRERVFTEAPRWVQSYLAGEGVLASADVQRVMGVAAPLDASTEMEVSTNKFTSGGLGMLPAQADIPRARFPYSATVAVAYGREKAPYDTSTGLVITNFYPDDDTGSSVLSYSWSSALIAASGQSLIQIGDEILAYETATFLGGTPKQWRLNNVWRALLDTAPHDHAIGERVYFLHLGTLKNRVGRRGWDNVSKVLGRFVPTLGIVTGSGKDNTNTLTLRQRSQLPPRVADFSVSGFNMSGVQGIPATAGRYKSVTMFEEAFDAWAVRRDRKTSTIVRGDAADENQLESGISYRVDATKVGAAKVQVGQTLVNNPILGAQAYLLGKAGHGAIDVSFVTRRTVQSGETGVSFPAGTAIECWDPPTIRFNAPRWRNQLANSRFDYGFLNTGWIIQSGGPGVGSDASSIPRDSTGYYLKATSAATAIVKQTVDISGYLPRKMTARIVWYEKNFGSDPNDSVTVTLAPLDAADVALAGPISGSVVGPATYWSRQQLSIAELPADTAKLAVTLQLNAVSGEFAIPQTAVTECELIVGQHLYNVLTNPSLDANTTSWTNVSNSFVVTTTGIISPSAGFAQGGAFASSAIQQDYTLLTGWEVGSTVVLRAWRAQTIAGDTGKITLQCLDAVNTVLATVDTGAEDLATLNQWVRRRLVLDVPAGTAKIRVRLDAVRTGGAGNSGACFDELILSVHKELDASYERVLTFDAPTVHPVPATWQDWMTAFPTLFDAGLLPPVIFAGGDPSVNTGIGYAPITMKWSDGVARAAGSLKGQFGGGVTKVDAYRFERASGSGAIDYQTAQENVRFLAPSSSQAFSVLVDFAIDEPGFSTQAGLVGRRDSASGWDLSIDSTGHVRAVLQGTGGTKTATRPSTTVHDGALHMAAIVYDPIAQTLTVYDERGGTAVSTATGLGEIANTSAACPFRIGRGRDTIDTLPGWISRVRCFPGVALSSSQIAAHWNYGKDPNGTALTVSRLTTVWTPNTPDSAGEALVPMATDQIALGYRADLSDDGGTGLGLAIGSLKTNLVPSFNFANGSAWSKDGSTTLTQGVTDATGRPRGVTVVSPDTSNGLKLVGVTLAATPATVQLVFWARAATGTPTLNVELLDATDLVVDTQSVSLNGGTLWRRYTTSFSGWTGPTATGRIRFVSSAGSTTFDLTHVMYVGQGTEIPSLIPNALDAEDEVSASLFESVPVQFNAEGEIVAVGVATEATPSVGSIARVANTLNNKNVRELSCQASAVPRLDHFDSVTPTNVTSSGTAIDWTQIWTIRGRWCSLGTLDNAANAFAGIVVDGNVDSAVYGRAATWTYDTTAGQLILLGGGAYAPLNAYLRSVTVRAREPKLV